MKYQNSLIPKLTLLLCLACGEDNLSLLEKFRDQNRSKELIPVSLNVKIKQSSFSLSTVTSISGSIINCVSGYAPSFDQTTVSLELYRHDASCRATITSFTSNGEVFTPAEAFNTEVGQNTRFSGASGSDARVSVAQQLSDNLQEVGESIEIDILPNHKGADEALDTGTNIIRVEVDDPDATVDEDTAGAVTYTFYKVTEANQNALTVNYSVSGSASSLTDYDASDVPGTITILVNETKAVLSVDIFNDAIPEIDKTLIITVDPGIGYDHYSSATLTITDSD